MAEDRGVGTTFIYIAKTIGGSWGWRPHGDLNVRDGYARYAAARYAARRYYIDQNDKRTLIFAQDTYRDC